MGGLCSAFLDYISKSTVVDFVFMSETDSLIQDLFKNNLHLSLHPIHPKQYYRLDLEYDLWWILCKYLLCTYQSDCLRNETSAKCQMSL